MKKPTPYKEIRKFLEESENPLFFYDDDADGLSSYLILKNLTKNSKGILAKCSSQLPATYILTVDTYNPDKIFILDKPLVDKEFVDKVNVPIIMIDHHELINPKGVKYYNPKQFKEDFPTCIFCYKITKQDLWLATVGSISDWHKPKFLKEFCKKYPGLLNNPNQPISTLLFEPSPLSKLCRIFNFILKGKNHEIKKSINALEKIKTPYELLENKTKESQLILNHFEKIDKKYQKLLKQALKQEIKDNFLIYLYQNPSTSLTSFLSNNLLHFRPDSFIIVGREKDGYYNISLRSPANKKILKPLKKAMQGLEARGGGHDHACGCNILKEDLPNLIENLKKYL